MRKANVIEYEDETIVDLKENGKWYQYKFGSWDEAFDALPNLNPESDSSVDD